VGKRGGGSTGSAALLFAEQRFERLYCVLHLRYHLFFENSVGTSISQARGRFVWRGLSGSRSRGYPLFMPSLWRSRSTVAQDRRNGMTGADFR